MNNPYFETYPVLESTPNLLVHHPEARCYTIQTVDLYDHYVPDNWLMYEILHDSFRFYKCTQTGEFIIINDQGYDVPLVSAPNTDYPLTQGSLRIPESKMISMERARDFERILRRNREEARQERERREAEAEEQQRAHQVLYESLLIEQTPSIQPFYPPGSLTTLRSLLSTLIVPEENPFTFSRDFVLPACSGVEKPIEKPLKHVSEVMIKDAVSKEQTCPITMNPLTLTNAVATSPCYHIFDKEGITKWLAKSNQCPTCRTPCTL